MNKLNSKFNKAFRYFGKPENIFLTVAGLFGLVAVFLVPPGWNSDEQQHYLRVEQITDGEILSAGPDGKKGGQWIGGFVNRGAADFIYRYNYHGSKHLDKKSLSPDKIWRDGLMRTPEDDKVFVSFNGSAVYPPITYLPQVIGNAIGRFIGLPVYGSFLLAKLFGLFFYLISIFFSIKLIPRGKWILAAVALLATAIVQSAAMSADAVTFSAIFVFIAYIFYLFFNNTTLNTGHIVKISALACCLGLIKPTYIALVPLAAILLFSNKKNKSKKTIVKMIAGMLAAVILAAGWLKLVSYVGSNGGEYSNKAGQAAYLLNNPLSILPTIARTYFGIVPGGFWNKFYDISFTNFIWDSVRMSSGYSFIALIGLLISVGIKDGKEKIKKSAWDRMLIPKVVSVGVFVCSFLLINLALYIYYTPVGSNVVEGVQFRYILPFLILFLLPFQNYYANQKLAKILMLACLIVPLIASFLAIYKHIYIL